MSSIDDAVNTLSKTKELFIDLLKILKAEGDSNVNYAVNELSVNISKIEHALSIMQSEDVDLNLTISEIQNSYKSMFPPRGGLTEFFVWRDSFDDRVKANESLEKIKDELRLMLGI